VKTPILDLSISVDYRTKPGVLKDCALKIFPAESVGLVGLSGSGKSTLSLAILRLLDRNATVNGEATFEGRDLLQLNEREMRAIRGKGIGLVLQSPMAALNPSLTIGKQLYEAWRCHDGAASAWAGRADEVLQSVSLPTNAAFLKNYPRQLSVGLAQRVLIAMAILHNPRLLIADEPTSALDVITQAEILELFTELRRKLGVAVLFISHDLLSIAAHCDRVAILEGGSIVESGPTQSIFESPAHPFTRRLVDAIPTNAFRATTVSARRE
jgi:ABC-type dipeptide/oligopeptide/nickel transport system ATPase component